MFSRIMKEFPLQSEDEAVETDARGILICLGSRDEQQYPTSKLHSNSQSCVWPYMTSTVLTTAESIAFSPPTCWQTF